MKEIRIKIGKEKYLIWNKELCCGVDTPNEDLWNKGYEFRCNKIFCIKFIIANKRK
jgi:hypothetical protein